MTRIDFDKGYIIVDAIDAQSEHSDALTENDREFLATLNSPARRAQWSTWRRIVRNHLGEQAEIRYNGLGAPLLVAPVGEVAFLSVSHTASHAAVMFSASRCGIDIETPDRNFERVTKRYIAHEELGLSEVLGDDFGSTIWCAKEALYKFGGHTDVDFTQDILITGADTAAQTLSAEAFSTPTPTLHYRNVEGERMCFVAE